MRVGHTLHVTTREAWRAWLRRNHRRAREIWLVYHRKETGRPRIPYNVAVEEALCFGWIDSNLESLGDGALAQRFTPRRKGSQISETNKARVRRLVADGRMTRAGLEALEGQADVLKPPRFRLAPDLAEALQADPVVWKNFQRFPIAYRRIRIGWIEGARGRPGVLATRLRYFIKMTRQNRQYGMVRG